MKNLLETKAFVEMKRMAEAPQIHKPNPDHIIEGEHYVFDYSRMFLPRDFMDVFEEAAKEIDLSGQIKAMFSGKKVNVSENRPALHVALRAPAGEEIRVDGENVVEKVYAVKSKIKDLAGKFRSGQLAGVTGKPLDTVVNIGIGGSYLGPLTVVEALHSHNPEIKTFFLSNVDDWHLKDIFSRIDPEKTLFVVVSKSFGTKETLMNASYVKEVLKVKYGIEIIEKQFVAVTANPGKAEAFGINPENIFPVWDWVGGRFSLWSAAGLSIPLALGFDVFEELLEGARTADKDFASKPFRQNPAVIKAILSFYYIQFKGAQSEVFVPYRQKLAYFPLYLQQLMMESLGKSVRRNGKPVNYPTGNVIWGETGTNAQHSFFQLLHQGTVKVPVHFTGSVQEGEPVEPNRKFLLANMLSQAQSLFEGKASGDHNRHFEGGRPSDIWLVDRFGAFQLGYLLAVFEHQTYVMSLFWDINAFDQFGVELGKINADHIFDLLKSGQIPEQSRLYAFLRNKL